MDDKLLRFFKLVNFNDCLAFEDATLKDMVVNRKENTWTLRINAKDIVDLNAMLSLKRLCSDGVDDVKHIYIEMTYENLDSERIIEYFMHYLDILIEANPSLSGLNRDLIRIDDEIIIVEVTSKIEETILKKSAKRY